MKHGNTTLEGSWDDMLARSAELTGQRVRVTVLSEAAVTGAPHQPSPDADILALLSQWQQTPLTDAELEVLDGLERHLHDRPFSLATRDETDR